MIKFSDVLLAMPDRFVCRRLDAKFGNQLVVYACKNSADSGCSLTLPHASSKSEVDAQPPPSIAPTSGMDRNSELSASSVPDESQYISAMHQYLLANNHTSRHTSINLARICSVEAICKHKPFKNFRPSEALRLHSHLFHLVNAPDGVVLVYAAVPKAARAGASADLGAAVKQPLRTSYEAPTRRLCSSPADDSQQPSSSFPVAKKRPRDADDCACWLFVRQVHFRATRADLQRFFSQAGEVVDVELICDFRTKKSKGRAYVQMNSTESVAKAVLLSGQLLLGLPCIVAVSNTAPNRSADEKG
jgi:hypothetical protein